MRLPTLMIVASILGLILAPALFPAASHAEPPAYVNEWGSLGSGPGQFNTLRDVAVDAAGNVYAVDYGNYRVQKFTRDGVFITQWGSSGSGQGQFYQPHGLGIDPSGYLYVADSGNHRIQKFTLSGGFVASWGSGQSAALGSFSGPRDVAVDSGGNVYVADTFNGRIQKLNSNGLYLTHWDGSSGAGGALDRPIAIDIGANGNVYVLDYGNYQVQEFTPTGNFLSAWGQLGSGEGQIGPSHGIGHTITGDVLLADSQNNRVQVFTDDGTFTDEFGSYGTGPGEFNYPRGVAANADSLVYVADANNNRIQVFQLPGSTPPAPNSLRIADGQGISAGSSVTIPVHLRTNTNVMALEFKLRDTPDWLTGLQVSPVGRASHMTVGFTDTGDIHVLVYDPLAEGIPAGSGDILNLELEIDPSAVLGDSVTLELVDVVLADMNGDAVTLAVQNGVFHISRMVGDINGDNLVDVGDLVRLTEVILGTGAPPTTEELLAADCNGDLATDALDVACLLNLIVGGSSNPGALLLATAQDMQDLLVLSDANVRGLQMEFPAGTQVRFAETDIQPFSIYQGSRATGEHVVLAFDPTGQSWERGAQAKISVSSPPTHVAAYGSGGRALPVSSDSDEIRIGELPIARGLRALPSQPNPFRSSTKIRFSTDIRGVVRVSVFSISGALVSTLPERVVEPGTHAWPWNALDRSGRPLPAGLYIALVEGSGNRSAVRLAHLGK